MAKTIILKAPEMTIQKEAALKASVDITPGMLCAYDSDGVVKPHATAGGDCSPLFAVENDIIGGGIDTPYATDGENVLLRYCSPGVEVNALLANGENASFGSLLKSNGDGTLAVYTAPSQAVNEGGSATYTIAQKPRAAVVRALAALNNTSGSPARLKVEVL